MSNCTMLQQVQCCMTVSQSLQCIMQIRKLITICPQLQKLVNGHFKSLKLHIFLSDTHICTANTHPLSSTNLVLQAIKLYYVYYMTHCLEAYNIWNRAEQDKNVFNITLMRKLVIFTTPSVCISLCL